MNDVTYKNLVDLIFNYEKFLKESHLINYKYHNSFNEKLTTLLKLNKENNALTSIITAVNNKVDQEKMTELINNLVNDYNNSITRASKFDNNAKLAINKIKGLSKENEESFDAIYYTYISNYHPALFSRIEENNLRMYKQLNSFYNDCNQPAFEEMLDLVKNGLRKFDENDEESILSLKKIYERLSVEIPSSIEKLKVKYPYVKMNVFDNDMTVLAEDADLRVSITKEKNMNEALQKDLFKLTGQSFKLEN